MKIPLLPYPNLKEIEKISSFSFKEYWILFFLLVLAFFLLRKIVPSNKYYLKKLNKLLKKNTLTQNAKIIEVSNIFRYYLRFKTKINFTCLTITEAKKKIEISYFSKHKKNQILQIFKDIQKNIYSEKQEKPTDLIIKKIINLIKKEND